MRPRTATHRRHDRTIYARLGRSCVGCTCRSWHWAVVRAPDHQRRMAAQRTVAHENYCDLFRGKYPLHDTGASCAPALPSLAAVTSVDHRDSDGCADCDGHGWFLRRAAMTLLLLPVRSCRRKSFPV